MSDQVLKSKEEVTEYYQQFSKMIFWYCGKEANRTGRSFDELLSDAYEAFVIAVHKYQEERGAFSTFMLRMFKWRALDRNKRTKMRVQEREVTLGKVEPSYEDEIEFSLSQDASQLKDLLVYYKKRANSRRLPSAVSDLKKEWDDSRIYCAMRELEESLY